MTSALERAGAVSCKCILSKGGSGNVLLYKISECGQGEKGAQNPKLLCMSFKYRYECVASHFRSGRGALYHAFSAYLYSPSPKQQFESDSESNDANNLLALGSGYLCHIDPILPCRDGFSSINRGKNDMPHARARAHGSND